MAKTFTTIINKPPTLVGLDFEISIIQEELAKLGWVQACFGISNVQKRQKSEEESKTAFNEGLRGVTRYDTYYPQGLTYGTGNGFAPNDVDLSFDDNYASRVFFLNNEDANLNIDINKWDWTSGVVDIEQPVSLILMANLQSLEYANSESLKISILSALQKVPRVRAFRMFERMEDVWKEFTITPELNGLTRWPYYCLRINFKINYTAEPYNYAAV